MKRIILLVGMAILVSSCCDDCKSYQKQLEYDVACIEQQEVLVFDTAYGYSGYEFTDNQCGPYHKIIDSDK